MIHFITRWIGEIWLVFGVVWLVAAFASKRTVQRQTYGSRVLQSGLAFIGLLLVFNFCDVFKRGWLTVRVIPHTPSWVLGGAVLAIAGVLLCFWARLILGANWSGVVTIKQDHELVRRGPYAFVRHPIYTGLLTATLGTALVYGFARCFVGVLLFALALWLKSQMEEQFMVQQFGEQYAQYRKRTRALLPFLL